MRKKNRRSGCCLNLMLKTKREVRAIKKEAQKSNKGWSNAFVEAALWERRCKLRTLENSHLNGLLEYLTFTALKATTVEELEKAKDEYYQLKRKCEARLQEKENKVKDFVLIVDGQRKPYSVF